MRVYTRRETRPDRLGQNAQPAPRAGLSQGPERPNRRSASRPAEQSDRNTRQTSTFILPVHAGLALPRLGDVPSHYSIDNEQAASAQLALKLLEVGLVQACDDAPYSSPNALIEKAITRTLGDSLSYPGLDLVFRVATFEEQGRHYLLVFVDGVPVISFDAAARVFDKVEPQLGPSILGYVYHTLDLTPAFTPEVAKDIIRWHYWQGLDDDSILLAEAEEELEYQFSDRKEAFTREDVVAYAQEHFLTSQKVDARLAPRYQEHGALSLERCRGLCTEKLEQALPIITALEKLAELQGALPERDRHIDDLIEGELPFGVIVTLGGDHDLVREVYGEYEQQIWQAGMDFQPSYALGFDPDDPETLTTLKDALTVCGLILEQTDALFHALEAMS